MKKKVLIAIGALVILLAIGAGVTALLTREKSEPVKASRVVAQFRADSKKNGDPPARRDVPVAGVYRYATTGYEQAKSPIGTRRHTYPRETTVSVVPTACGWHERWDVLDTRLEIRDYCVTAAGLRVNTFTDAHEFFGHSDRRTYRCTGSPADTRCTVPGTTIDERSRNVGEETLVVGGRRVPTTHVTLRDTNSGDTIGAGVIDRWLARPSGLLIRSRVTNANTTHTFAGDVTYMEQYELTLSSLEPLR